jgi:hypothetical protein
MASAVLASFSLDDPDKDGADEQSIVRWPVCCRLFGNGNAVPFGRTSACAVTDGLCIGFPLSISQLLVDKVARALSHDFRLAVPPAAR